MQNIGDDRDETDVVSDGDQDNEMQLENAINTSEEQTSFLKHANVRNHHY